MSVALEWYPTGCSPNFTTVELSLELWTVIAGISRFDDDTSTTPVANILPTPIDLVLEDTIATYITLLNFTEQGVKTIRELPARISAGHQALEAKGGKIVQYYLTLGA